MTRPQMIRADTIDLQDHDSPSAKDHQSRPSQLHSTADNRHAPHQNQTIRMAEKETLDELARGPVSSDDGRSPYYHEDDRDIYREQDELTDTINGLESDQMGHYRRNGLSPSEQDNLDDDDGDDQFDDDDLMDKISSSPSIDDEDIDFEFVYALHTFVATVEGQANATKGDTMVLLDDSNSYWWLVRVVKDGSIGYLPAEHIETPTERLARLNKHRNIDLSATMLGDNAEKSKNPLKKAMRRRNTKTVTFASPTYFEASDIDYSTGSEEGDDQFLEDDDEDDDEDEQEEEEDEDIAQTASSGKQDEKKGNVAIEPLRPKHQNPKEPSASHEEQPDAVRKSEESQLSDDELDNRPEGTHGRSRNGVVRNTDSFFKDDTAETKKISLTPNLLRDDSANNNHVVEQKEMKTRGSFESFDKGQGSGERSKDDKKRKDKKPGMLSGLFKRKDRKSKALDDDGDDPEKISEESARSFTPPRISSESLKEDVRAAKSQLTPQRNPSKLQKSPPRERSPMKGENQHTAQVDTSIRSYSPAKQMSATKGGSATTETQWSTSQDSGMRTPDSFVEVSPPATSQQQTETSVTPPVKSLPTSTPQAVISGSTSSQENNQAQVSHPPASDTREITESQSTNRTGLTDRADTESPIDILPSNTKAATTHPSHNLPSSAREPSTSPISSYSTSPDLAEDYKPKAKSVTPAPITSTWNDGELREYLDDGSDIRDLLIIVNDNSNVQAAGPDHPITGNLFKEESKTLNDMANRLDEMLSSWLSRKTVSAK